MEYRLTISKKFKTIAMILIGIGVVSFALGFAFDAKRTWANYLLVNYYFLSLAIGAAFFGAIQYITQSGWSAAFKRIPEAMVAYIPFAAVFFLILFFGMHSIYEWTHEEVVAEDQLLQHKSAYLNIPFFFARLVLFFGAWIVFSKLLQIFTERRRNRQHGVFSEIGTLFPHIYFCNCPFVYPVCCRFTDEP
jgi:hypothetical protein